MAAMQCLAIVKLSNAFDLIRFPVFGGEDDFSLRASWFLFRLLPAFMILGFGIGYFTSFRETLLGAAGMSAGGIGAVAVAMLMQPTINQLAGSREANLGVAVYFSGWLLLSVLFSGGALALARRRPPGGAP